MKAVYSASINLSTMLPQPTQCTFMVEIFRLMVINGTAVVIYANIVIN